MLEAKISEEIVAAKVKRTGVALDPTPAQLVTLKKAGASDSLLALLMDPTKSYERPAAAEPPAATPAATPAAQAPAPAAPPVREIGVYFKKKGEWVEIQPEVVNWKTGGTLKSLASVGVVKKDLNGNIDGPSSRNSVTAPVELLVITPEGVAVTEYQLLRFRVNKDYREFRSVTGGILNQRSGAMRDLVPFEGKKVASRQFEIVLPANLGAGQYGLLPPGVGGSSTTSAVSAAYGRMYTFHIVE
jgi:hypothetical protein